MGKTAKLTVRLPESELAFIRKFAVAHGVTLTEIVSSYFKRLRLSSGTKGLHPAVERFSGIIPADLDIRSEMTKHRARKMS